MKHVRQRRPDRCGYEHAKDERPHVAQHCRERDRNYHAAEIRRQFKPKDLAETDLFTQQHQADVLQTLQDARQRQHGNDQFELCLSVEPRGGKSGKRHDHSDDDASDQFR
jgi:hypothetical protein